jgi:hypothetical protein
MPRESGAVVQGAGLTGRAGPHARLEGGAGVGPPAITVYPRAAPMPAHGVPAPSYPRPEQAKRSGLYGWVQIPLLAPEPACTSASACLRRTWRHTITSPRNNAGRAARTQVAGGTVSAPLDNRRSFLLGERVSHRYRAVLAFADGGARWAPRPRALLTTPCLVQHPPDRRGTDPRQPPLT